MKKLILLLVLVGGLISCEKEVEVEKIVYVDKIVEVKVEVEKIVTEIKTITEIIDNTDYDTIDDLMNDISALELQISQLGNNAELMAQLAALPSIKEIEAYAIMRGFHRSFYLNLNLGSRFTILNKTYNNICTDTSLDATTDGICLRDINADFNKQGLLMIWKNGEIFLIKPSIDGENTGDQFILNPNFSSSASDKYELALQVVNYLNEN